MHCQYGNLCNFAIPVDSVNAQTAFLKCFPHKIMQIYVTSRQPGIISPLWQQYVTKEIFFFK